jgi:hypothetical protein
VKENPGIQLARLQTHIVTLRKEQYRLTRIAADEYASARVRNKAQEDAHGLSLEMLKVVDAVKRLEGNR